MRCRVCVGQLRPTKTDLPFKVSDRTIVIIKGLPALQCDQCGEYSMDDAVFARVEEILLGANKAAELEIAPFAV